MQIQFKTVIFLSCAYLMFTNVVNAAVYQCEKNGVVEFSQQPCGKDARLVIIQEQNPHVSNLFESAPVKPDSGVDSYIRVKQIDAEIQQHHNKIDTLTFFFWVQVVFAPKRSINDSITDLSIFY